MPVPDNVIRANIRATLGTSEEMVHTLHFRRVNTSVGNNPSLQDIANTIVSNWSGMLGATYVTQSMKQLLKPTTEYVTCDVYSLDADGHATGQAQTAFDGTAKGTSGSSTMPPECAIVASLRTGLPGRSRRGRLYLGGFTVDALETDGSTVNDGAQETIAEFLAHFGDAMKMTQGVDVDKLNWSVLSRTLTETNKITEIRVGSLWDVQRRRQNGLTETFKSTVIDY